MASFDDYKKVIENINDGVYFVDRDRNITFWNKAAEEMIGFLSVEVEGRCCTDNILNHVDEDFNPLCICGCPLEKTLNDGKPREETVYLHHKDGNRVKINTKIVPLIENDEIIGAFEIFTDATDFKTVQRKIQRLQKLAWNDKLTSLPNRLYLEKYIKTCIDNFETFNRTFGLLFFDIDNFRDFNNKYGHDVGDVVLKTVSKSLLNLVENQDEIGRWGGEEFIGIFFVEDEEELSIKAEKMRSLVESSSLRYDDKSLFVTVSIGATLIKEDDTMDSVVKRADELMYLSKKTGKNKVTIG